MGEELEQLEALPAGARGGEGRLAVIEGAAGIGKTRLVEAALDAASRVGIETLSARSGELERDLPFGAVRQVFERRLRRLAPNERAAMLESPAALSGAILVDGGSA